MSKKSKKIVSQNKIIWSNYYSIYHNGDMDETRKSIKNVSIRKED